MHGSLPNGALVGILGATIILHSLAWSQSVSIAKFRNNATGAYSIVMDDYGSGDLGLRDYADTMLVNRGLALSVNVIVGNCTPANWAYARELHSHGHEITNHSWSHKDPWGAADFLMEIDSSKAIIEREVPGNKCLFFGFPYEKFSDTMVNYLRTREYVGCRAGNFSGPGLNPPAIPDPFRSNYKFYGASDGLAGLNAYVAQAISFGGGGWALRETHQVLYNQGYNPVNPDTFALHLDFCKEKVDSGLLWMAPVSEVIMYARERASYTVSITGQSATSITIGFTTDAAEINPSPRVDNTLYDYPLTLLVDLPLGFVATDVRQGTTQVPFVAMVNRIQFDALPYGGPVIITASTRIVPGIASRAQEMSEAARLEAPAIFDLRGSVMHRVGSAGSSGMYLAPSINRPGLHLIAR